MASELSSAIMVDTQHWRGWEALNHQRGYTHWGGWNALNHQHGFTHWGMEGIKSSAWLHSLGMEGIKS